VTLSPDLWKLIWDVNDAYRGPPSVLWLWDNVLSEQDRAALNEKSRVKFASTNPKPGIPTDPRWETYKKFKAGIECYFFQNIDQNHVEGKLDPSLCVMMLAVAKNIRAIDAITRLGRRSGQINDYQFRQFRGRLRVNVLSLAAAKCQYDLVLDATQMVVYHKKRKIKINWSKNQKLWAFVMRLAKAARKGEVASCPGYDTRYASKTKSRLEGIGFPLDVLVPAGRGRVKIDIAKSQIYIWRKTKRR